MFAIRLAIIPQININPVELIKKKSTFEILIS